MPIEDKGPETFKESTAKPPKSEAIEGGGLLSPGLITSVGGLSIATVLFVFRDLIAKNIFPQLTQIQATVVIFSIIGLTFFIAVIGMYAWLATRRGIQFKYVIAFLVLILTILAILLIAGMGIYTWLATTEGISMPHILVLMILTVIILAFLFTGIYMVSKPDKADLASHITSNQEQQPEPLNPWYLKAMEAMARGNKSISLEYINRGLRDARNRPEQEASLVALKIKVLLLIGGSDNLTEANQVANHSYGRYLPELDRWIACLKRQQLLSSIITTEADLESQCPSPNYNLACREVRSDRF